MVRWRREQRTLHTVFLRPNLSLFECKKYSYHSEIVHTDSEPQGHGFFCKAILQPSMVLSSRKSCNGMHTIALFHMGTSIYIAPSPMKVTDAWCHCNGAKLITLHPTFNLWFTLKACLSGSITVPQIICTSLAIKIPSPCVTCCRSRSLNLLARS